MGALWKYDMALRGEKCHTEQVCLFISQQSRLFSILEAARNTHPAKCSLHTQEIKRTTAKSIIASVSWCYLRYPVLSPHSSLSSFLLLATHFKWHCKVLGKRVDVSVCISSASHVNFVFHVQVLLLWLKHTHIKEFS